MIYEFPFQHIKYGLQLRFCIMYMCNNLYLFNIKYLGLLSSEICRILFMISRSESSGKVTLQRAEIDGGTALRFSGTNEHFSFDWGWWLKYPNNQGNKTVRKTTCSFLERLSKHNYIHKLRRYRLNNDSKSFKLIKIYS